MTPDAEVVSLPNSPASKKKNKRKKLTADDVRQALPAIDSILVALSHFKGLAPYVQALRILTVVGTSGLPDQTRVTLENLREVRQKIVALEEADTSTDRLRYLRAKQDALVDMLLAEMQ